MVFPDCFLPKVMNKTRLFHSPLLFKFILEVVASSIRQGKKNPSITNDMIIYVEDLKESKKKNFWNL